jgi:hypothetical protein
MYLSVFHLNALLALSSVEGLTCDKNLQNFKFFICTASVSMYNIFLKGGPMAGGTKYMTNSTHHLDKSPLSIWAIPPSIDYQLLTMVYCAKQTQF